MGRRRLFWTAWWAVVAAILLGLAAVGIIQDIAG